MMLADDERFSSVNQAAAVEACRSRIVELDGEILSEIATGEDDDEANTSPCVAQRAGNSAPRR